MSGHCIACPTPYFSKQVDLHLSVFSLYIPTKLVSLGKSSL